MYRLTFVFFGLLFFLFRPFQLERPGMLFPGDDVSYFAFSTAIVFGEYPKFEKEYIDEGAVPPLSRVGPALMSLPLAFAGSLVDRLSHNPVVDARTRENIVTSWTLFGAVLAAGIYAWLGMFILYRALCRIVARQTAQWAVVVCALLPGLILYAYRRPVFSHVYEFFLQCGLFYLFINEQTQSRWRRRIGQTWVFILTVLFCALSMLVRQNGMSFALLWPVLIFGVARWKGDFRGKFPLRFCLVTTAIWALYAILKYIPWLSQKDLYVAANAAFEKPSFFWKLESPWFFLKRTWTVLLGADWGLLYTAPHLLVGAVGLYFFRPPLRKWFAILSLPILLNFYICLFWKGQGGWYGYRYFVFSAAPILAAGFAVLWESHVQRRPRLYALLIALSVLPLVSTLLFEATPQTLIHGVTTEFGERNAGNLTYQWEVWKVILASPLYFLQSISKTGPVYVLYLFAHLLGIAHLLPAKFSELYPRFSDQMLVKTLLLYVTPWVLYLALCTGKQKVEYR